MPESVNPGHHGHEILLPFENGRVARVSLALYKAPKGQHRPVDAYVVTECEGIFTQSARRAAETVFSLAGTRVAGTGPVVAGFDVRDVTSGAGPATGESGGLAFALALAGHLFKHDPGPLAATGVVEGTGGGGPVGRVNGIVAKIGAAVDHLPENARILYPAENHHEIPEALAARARRKGHMLCPVATVAEAVGTVFPEELIHGNPNVKKTRAGTSRTVKQMGRLILLAVGTLLAIAALMFAAWNGLKFRTDADPNDVPPKPKITISPQPDIAVTEVGGTGVEETDTAPQTEKSAAHKTDMDKGFD